MGQTRSKGTEKGKERIIHRRRMKNKESSITRVKRTCLKEK